MGDILRVYFKCAFCVFLITLCIIIAIKVLFMDKYARSIFQNMIENNELAQPKDLNTINTYVVLKIGASNCFTNFLSTALKQLEIDLLQLPNI